MTPEDRFGFLPTRGEMAGRIRAFDWGATPLGEPEVWPQNLRNALSLCLSSRFPLIVWWGEELHMLYNDAYIPFLGSIKHPAALGQPGQAAWGEIWPGIGPMLHSVLRTGEATWSTDALYFFDRALPREEVYVTFTYGPVLAADGQTVDGVFCPCTETTEKIVSARRLETLGKLGTRSLEMRSIEAVSRKICMTLEESGHDVGFALIYRFCAQGQVFGLLACCGLERERATDPSPWPLLQAAQSRQPMQVAVPAGLAQGAGPWPEPPTLAHIEPLYWNGDGSVSGVMVLGVSPRRPLDAAYRAFLHLVASHTGSALANAVAYEQESRRAAALAEIDCAKTDFFSNVSHEFRTPLTLMLGPIEEAMQHQDSRLRPEALHMLHRNAMRLQKLVNNLLDFSSIEAGRMQARYEPTDLAQATRELASVFRSAIEAAGLVFRVECPPLRGPVHVDRDMYEKIVLNLLSNAFKFTLQGEISVSLHELQEAVELRVEDTGVGIAEHHLPRLFERFHRIEGQPARTHEGSGIGLALVQELVRLHGGSVQSQSTQGQGTRFAVSLPKGIGHLPPDRIGRRTDGATQAPHARHYVDEARRWQPAPAGEGSTAHLPGAQARPDRQGPPRTRILCADDNADMRDYIRQLLSPQYEVDLVADGESALARIASQAPDLVLADVMMPRLDGFGLLQALRTDERTRAIPVIMLSARAGQEARVGGLQAGADDYLIKPFSARELLARVEAHLRLARLREQTHAALQANEKRLRAIIDQLPAGVGVCDMEGTLVLSNATMERFVPKAIPSALPERIPRWQGWDADGAPVAPEHWPGKRALRGEMVVPGPEMLYTDEDGQPWWMRVSASPLRDDGGQVVGACMVIQDMTQLKRAEHELREADRRKDEFLATLAHELRNPLAPISNGLQVLRRVGGHSEEVRRSHEMMERQVRHMVHLVDDLLEISRISTGKIQLHPARVELAPLLRTAVEDCRADLEEAGHDLMVELPAAPVWLDADPVRLTQVVCNLLNNAAKYTDPGGHVRLAAWTEEASAVISISDDGIGMPPAMLDRIFDLFTQLDQGARRAQGGLGIGLTLVRSLVQMHGGAVQARSEGHGLGSEFIVRLPLPEQTPAAAARLHSGQTTAGTALGRILVVDDNQDAADTLATVLGLQGAEVLIAHDGPSAIRACAAFRPDVVLLDIGLPGMDGFEVARALRADKGLGPLVLIALTGWGQEKDLLRSREAGMDYHFVKPADLDALEALLIRKARDRAGRL